MDPVTIAITTPLFTFIEWFENYDEIYRDSINEEAEKVKDMAYNLTDPTTTVFEPI